ncbi:hypothetical protein AF332_26105 [Sporosarcina globispora]|uniref:DUF5626 domain-containing protein n=1 Tax=Sporosarcina globispora TaxID=1459 RepID=A0A0M0GJ74_SPOGL|nr:DUF5626 family protein [Sporosarcina globispora]KON89955.1 hypothetical protein AF332_26105 [Sporosarcina globispora]
MGKLKWLGFLVVAVGIMVLGSGFSNASAVEIGKNNDKKTEEFELQFDMTMEDVQEKKYVKENGEEVTVTIEPVETVEEPGLEHSQPSGNGLISPLATHYFPYGTTTYKVSAFTPYLGMSYYIKVYVPSGNISGSKITSAYDANYWIIGGYLSGIGLTRSDKLANYSADAIWMGGLGASNVYLKASLSNNVITTSNRM